MVLIESHKTLPSEQQVTSCTFSSKVSRLLSFANVVRGELGNSKSSDLKGWGCRNCGSWDVFAAVSGENNAGNQAGPLQ